MKQYNGEKAIISLTSWKARINTVCKTLFSLIDQCPGFHIVLVLSEEEFPKKEDELPENLKIFIDNDLIEVLWVYKNYKSFKKVLFTIDKYRDVPVISADDDCIYKYNYAEELYDKWVTDKRSIWTYHCLNINGKTYQHGPSTLFRPYCFFERGINLLSEKIIATHADDVYYSFLADKYRIKIKNIRNAVPYVFHDSIQPLSAGLTLQVNRALAIISSDVSNAK